MTHYTYKLTHNTNSIQYIGVRSCKGTFESDFTYMSSSKVIKEIGGENFTKELLQIHSTRAEAEKHEMFLLTEVDAKNNELFYNRCNGAEAFTTQGLTKENSKLMRESSERNKRDWEENKEAKKALIHHKNRDYSNHMPSLEASRGTGASKLTGEDRTEAQKAIPKSDMVQCHTEDAIAKRVKTITGRVREEHSKAMSGRKHMNKDGEYRMVKEDEQGKYLNNGWVFGAQKTAKVLKERTCPHCGKVGKGPNMTRYHFDNCKLKGVEDE